MKTNLSYRRIAVGTLGACGIALLSGCVAVPAGGYSDSYYYSSPAPVVAPSVYYQESYYGGGGYYGGRPYYGGAPVYGGPVYGGRVDIDRRRGYDGRDDRNYRGDRGDRGRPVQGARPVRPTQPAVSPGRPPYAGQGGGRPINQGAGAPVQYGHTANPNQGTSVLQGNN